MKAPAIVQCLLESYEELDPETVAGDAAVQSEIYPVLQSLGFNVTETSSYEESALDNSHKATTFVTDYKGPSISIHYGPRGAREPQKLEVTAGTWYTPLWRRENLKLVIEAPFTDVEGRWMAIRRHKWKRGAFTEQQVRRDIKRVYKVLGGRNVGSRKLLDRLIRDSLTLFR